MKYKISRKQFFALIFGIIAGKYSFKTGLQKLQDIYYKRKGLEILAKTFRFRPIDPKDFPSYRFTYKAVVLDGPQKNGEFLSV